MIKQFSSALLLAVMSFGAFNVALAQETAAIEQAAIPQNSWYGKPFALNGQDVVSFYDRAGPVEGSQEFTTVWDNTEWRFSSEANRDAFEANPAQYVPEFGGYCPVALTQGEAKIGTAEHFTLVDEKLYLNFNEGASNSFEDNPIGYIAAAKVNF
jgi:YHS domain-containing protein